MSLVSLRKAGYANIHQWSKKYSVMQRPDGNGAITVLLENPDFQRKKKGGAREGKTTIMRLEGIHSVNDVKTLWDHS